ncbi:MAG: hypothetical protein BM564_01530 [Bacteroidetes bacterium MedPE-SWsnd-G2]|nr:MAG: hypothetical protein BM564_01530 [Bacteroidetes bacterium MedPE-SWsnd-G2]
MIQNFRKEIWTLYVEPSSEQPKEVWVSNYGRVKVKSQDEDWKLGKLTKVNGFYTSSYLKLKGKGHSTYIHKVVAILYVDGDEDKKFVTHLDFDKANNFYKNLKWVNQAELAKIQRENPYIDNHRIRNSKLTEVRVRLIKKKIFDPKRKTRMRLIAKQFGISEMQLYRIKSGENWGHVKI